MKKTKKHLFIISLILAFSIFLVACEGSINDESSLPARYGDYGKTKANELADQFPQRYAGSNQEKQAADWLVEQLSDLGYEAEIQTFTAKNQAGESVQSQNIIVDVAGIGFVGIASDQNTSVVKVNESVQAVPTVNVDDKFLIVGAHYDTPVKNRQIELSEQTGTGDGIHNNAAGVASLLVLAEQFKQTPPGYNTKIVFFGANGSNNAGARAFLESLDNTQLDNLEVVYNIDRIYAGDKVYAHSGMNSVISEHEKSYDKRQKLYEMTDVYYNNLLLTNNDFSLYTNQNTFFATVPTSGQSGVYREWTTHTGDHSPFDDAGFPIVFVESFEYDYTNFDNIGKESTDPYFSIADGIINESNLDSSFFLNSYFQAAELTEETDVFGINDTEPTITQAEDEISQTLSLEELRENKNIDRLERRINNIAFLLLECTRHAGAEFELK